MILHVGSGVDVDPLVLVVAACIYIDDLGVSNFRREVDVDGRFASFFFHCSVMSILGKRSKRMWVDD